MDVKTAFLRRKLRKSVYVRPPQGFKIGTNKVLELKKALYGLKGSSRKWYECFNEFIISIGFTRSKYDYCLYYTKVDNDDV